jgi:hypothetical protein
MLSIMLFYNQALKTHEELNIQLTYRNILFGVLGKLKYKMSANYITLTSKNEGKL